MRSHSIWLLVALLALLLSSSSQAAAAAGDSKQDAAAAPAAAPAPAPTASFVKAMAITTAPSSSTDSSTGDVVSIGDELDELATMASGVKQHKKKQQRSKGTSASKAAAGSASASTAASAPAGLKSAALKSQAAKPSRRFTGMTGHEAQGGRWVKGAGGKYRYVTGDSSIDNSGSSSSGGRAAEQQDDEQQDEPRRSSAGRYTKKQQGTGSSSRPPAAAAPVRPPVPPPAPVPRKQYRARPVEDEDEEEQLQQHEVHDEPEHEKRREKKVVEEHEQEEDSSSALPKSVGQIRDASSELHIINSGDAEVDPSPADLEGGLIWSVSADSGSNSLGQLQSDGAYGPWTVQSTQIFKWARVAGMRPFLAIAGPLDEPKSVTIKGKLGGTVPTNQHQTQLTSTASVASGGRVPRAFSEHTQVLLRQPEHCVYKWTDRQSQRTTKCRGKLAAQPELEFHGTFLQLLDAGLHQDLEFMNHVHVTCEISSCRTASAHY